MILSRETDYSRLHETFENGWYTILNNEFNEVVPKTEAVLSKAIRMTHDSSKNHNMSVVKYL